MRTYGRITNPNGSKTWVVVQTDANGDNGLVWLTTLLQVLKLQPGESPFYANYGVRSQQAVRSQLPPDFDVSRTQAQFAPYFASLIIARTSGAPPTYSVKVILFSGQQISTTVQVPQ